MAKLKPYTNYKDSGVDWLGEIPEGWKVNRTKVLFKPIDERSKDGSEQLLSVSEHVGVKPRNQLKITMFQAESYEGYKLCQKGDLVINSLWAWKRGLGFSEYSGIVSTAYGVYRPKKSASIDYKFFHYLYRTKKYVDQLYIASRGIWKSRMQLSDSSFLNILVAYPEFETQVKARKYLEYKEKDIDKYIKKLKKEIALLKEHRQKIISQAVTCGLDENGKLRKKPKWNEGDPIPKGWQDSGVEWLGLIPEGWEVLPLKALTDYITRGNTPNYVEEGIPVVNQATFSKGYFDKQSLRFDSNRDTSRRGILKYGDILIASTGGGVLGKSYYFDEKDLYLADSHVTIIRSNRNKFHSKFVYYFFSINFDLINGILARGATNQTELQKQWLKNISLPIPPLVMQNKISNYLDEQMEYIQIELDKINEQIEFIKEYKQSLISKVVTGKIDVRNINNNLSED